LRINADSRFTVIFTASSPPRARSLTTEETRQDRTFVRAYPALKIKRSVQAYARRGSEPSRGTSKSRKKMLPLSKTEQCAVSIVHAFIASSNSHSLLASPSCGPFTQCTLETQKRQKRGQICSCTALHVMIHAAREMLFVNSRTAYQSFLMSNDHLNFRYSFLSSSVNMEEAS
jgi:hypothetical protein